MVWSDSIHVMLRNSLAKQADGEGFELPPNFPENHAICNCRGTNPTRAQSDFNWNQELSPFIEQLIELCGGMNQETIARVLSFAKFELASHGESKDKVAG